MLLVFDSYDGSGKSTLIDQFCGMYGTKVISPVLWSKGHQSTSPQFTDPNLHRLWSRSHYEMTTRMLTSGGRIDMIADRWMFTEKCYSPVVRGYQMDYYWKLDKALANNPMILWVYPTLYGDNWKDELKKRFVAKNESFVTFPQLLKIKANFDSLIFKSKIHRMIVDTNCGDNATELCRRIHRVATSIDPSFCR